MGERSRSARWVFPFLLAGFVLFLATPLAPQAKPKVKVVKKDAAVRVSPSATANVFKTLPLGTVLEVEESIGDWIKITIASEIGIKVDGYLRREDVEPAGASPPPPPPKKKSAPAGKDEADKKIIRLKDGSQIRRTIAKENPDSLEVETEFGKLVIKREQIAEIQSAPPRVAEKIQAKLPDPVAKEAGEKPVVTTEVRLGAPPKLKKRVPPQYPALAFNQKIEGIVILEVRIDAQGKVKDVKVLRSIAALDKAAVKAVEQWVYEPVVIEGRPREAVFTVTVDFKVKS